MTKNRLGSKLAPVIIVTAVVVAGGLALYWVARDRHQTSTSSQGSSSASSATSSTSKKSSQSAYIETADMKYPVPAGWASLPQQTLTNTGAASGIANVSVSSTRFTVAVEPESTSPTSDTMVNTYVLAFINRFQNHKLINQSQVTVDGVSGHQYIYTFGTTSQTTQELTVLIYKKRAFSLLFTSAQANFNAQQATFGKIIAGFQFK